MKKSNMPSLRSVLVSSLPILFASAVSADMQFIKAGFSIGKVLDEHVEFFDRDNDQLLDAITYGADNASLFEGQPNGFTIASLEAFSNNGLHTSKYIAVADLNGDGYQDLITYPFRILINNREGHFPSIPNWHPFTMVGDYFKLQVTDLDQNGVPDLFLSGSQRANGLYAGDTVLFMNVRYDPAAVSRGYFSYQKQINFSSSEPPLQGRISGMKPNGVAIGDLNNDGKPDVIFINSARGAIATSTSSVTLNNGSGTLVYSQALPDAEDIAVGDVDNDGDLDLYLARYGNQPDQLWLNNGNGTFTNSGQLLGIDNSINAAMADMDGDGDLDVVSTNHNVSSFAPHRIWLNDGNGQLTLSAVSFGSGKKTESLKLLDLDRDGDMDIVTMGGRASHPQQYYLFLSSNEVWLNQQISTDNTNLDFQAGIEFCQSNPQDYGLFNQSQIDEIIDLSFAEGVQACRDAPHDFGLFDQVDMDAQLQAGIEQGFNEGLAQGVSEGQQNCMTDPASCDLFHHGDLDRASAEAFLEGQEYGIELGRLECQSNPALCDLFDQSDLDEAYDKGFTDGRLDGKQGCIDDPVSCGLHSQSMLDLDIEAIIRRIIEDLPKGQVKSVCKKHPDSPICLYADQ